MSTPLVTIGPEASIYEAAKTMVKHGVRRLPVLERGRLVGVITITDFAKVLGWDTEKTKKVDPDMIIKAMTEVEKGMFHLGAFVLLQAIVA